MRRQYGIELGKDLFRAVQPANNRSGAVKSRVFPSEETQDTFRYLKAERRFGRLSPAFEG
jgi:hypothetical protein